MPYGWGDMHCTVLSGSTNISTAFIYWKEVFNDGWAEGGDSLEVAVACMYEFNGRRYDGVLDEDPTRHVNAFWYGLKKLSQYCEAAVRVDERAWDCFIDKVQFAYDDPVGRLAAQMDEKQIVAFVTAVDKLGAGK